jgi:hypothetical protein
MQKLFLSLLFALLAVTGVTAQTNSSRSSSRSGSSSGTQNAPAVTANEVTYQGTVSAAGRQLVELKTNRETVYLDIPRPDRQSMSLKNNDVVTVKGTETVASSGTMAGKKVITVTSVVANGTEYFIERPTPIGGDN